MQFWEVFGELKFEMMILQIAVLLGVISLARCAPLDTTIEDMKREIAHIKIDMEREIAHQKSENRQLWSALKDTQQVRQSLVLQL